MLECWDAGMLGFKKRDQRGRRNAGILRDAGMLGCWNKRAETESKRRDAGILKNAGMLGCWDAGMLGWKT